MSLVIRLLGTPCVTRDGVIAAPPRGRKVWGLLAYLVLSERPPPRSRIAGLLFGEADDPLGALRWSVAELRRCLGDGGAVDGDPLTLTLPPGTEVDVLVLDQPHPPTVLAAFATGELLEGISLRSSPVFALWLEGARRAVAGDVQSALREAALACLAAGDPRQATSLAERMLALDPLDPAAHELVVRCLSRGGERRAAHRQLAASRELLHGVLQLTAPGLEAAIDLGRDGADTAVGDRATALAQLEAGRSALDAGAVEPGLACLRLAAAEADCCGDDALRARSLCALGSGLVHVVRSRDEEGAAVLHEALALADKTGDRATAATVCRELGYVDVQAGRVATAGRWLTRATELAEDDEERCAVLGVRGMALSDRAYYAAALDLLGQSVDAARRCGRERQGAWSLALIGRVHLLRGDLEAATATVDDSLAIVERERWAAFKPFPEALRAELDLRAGRLEAASGRTEQAFRLACQLGDPCWEGMTLRVRGLVSLAEGRPQDMRSQLIQARERTTRVGDPYQWIHAFVLDALASVAITTGAPDAHDLVDRLQRLAGRAGLRELVVRAHVHRSTLGVPGAREAARLLAIDIDTAELDRLLARSASPG